MKIFKKITCLLLVLIFQLNVLAAVASAENLNEEIPVQDAFAEQYQYNTQFDHVMKDNSGNYALEVQPQGQNTPFLLPTGYMQVDLLDPDSVNAILGNPNLSEKIKSDIAKMAMNAQPCSECNTCNLLSVFSSDLLPQTRATTTSYYTYKGTQMKVDQISRDSHAGYESIGSGEKAAAIWEGITNVGLGIAGFASVTISIFGMGYTLMDAIASVSGANSVYPKSTNDVQAKIRFSGTTRYTYAYIEDWRIGCVSYYAYVNDITFDYDFYKDSVRTARGNFSLRVDKGVATESYSNHWAVAYNNYHSPNVDELLALQLGKKSFILCVD